MTGTSAINLASIALRSLSWCLGASASSLVLWLDGGSLLEGVGRVLGVVGRPAVLGHVEPRQLHLGLHAKQAQEVDGTTIEGAVRCLGSRGAVRLHDVLTLGQETHAEDAPRASSPVHGGGGKRIIDLELLEEQACADEHEGRRAANKDGGPGLHRRAAGRDGDEAAEEAPCMGA